MKETTARMVKIDSGGKSSTSQSKSYSSGIHPWPTSGITTSHANTSVEGVRTTTQSLNDVGYVNINSSEGGSGFSVDRNDNHQVDQNETLEIIHSDTTRVSFSDEVRIKTIPDCWDYLRVQGDEVESSSSSSSQSSSPLVMTNVEQHPLERSLISESTNERPDNEEEEGEVDDNIDNDDDIGSSTIPNEGTRITNPFRLPPDLNVNGPTMLKPIPQRPLHPLRARVQCITNAPQPDEVLGPRIRSSSPSSLSSSSSSLL